jgi:hypothetical protein
VGFSEIANEKKLRDDSTGLIACQVKVDEETEQRRSHMTVGTRVEIDLVKILKILIRSKENIKRYKLSKNFRPDGEGN